MHVVGKVCAMNESNLYFTFLLSFTLLAVHGNGNYSLGTSSSFSLCSWVLWNLVIKEGNSSMNMEEKLCCCPERSKD